jgi:hypothetical protein
MFGLHSFAIPKSVILYTSFTNTQRWYWGGAEGGNDPPPHQTNNFF